MAGGWRRQEGNFVGHQARQPRAQAEGEARVPGALGPRERRVHALLHVRLVPGLRPRVRVQRRREAGGVRRRGVGRRRRHGRVKINTQHCSDRIK